MRTLVIAANFHVDLPNPDPEKPSTRKPFTKGIVVDEADLPEGHTAEAWVEKGLADIASDQA